jgi:hypothetical protein
MPRFLAALSGPGYRLPPDPGWTAPSIWPDVIYGRHRTGPVLGEAASAGYHTRQRDVVTAVRSPARAIAAIQGSRIARVGNGLQRSPRGFNRAECRRFYAIVPLTLFRLYTASDCRKRTTRSGQALDGRIAPRCQLQNIGEEFSLEQLAEVGAVMIAYRHVWRWRSHRRWLGHAAELVAAADETEGALAEAERQKMIEDIAIKDIIMHDRRHPSPPSCADRGMHR